LLPAAGQNSFAASPPRPAIATYIGWQSEARSAEEHIRTQTGTMKRSRGWVMAEVGNSLLHTWSLEMDDGAIGLRYGRSGLQNRDDGEAKSPCLRPR